MNCRHFWRLLGKTRMGDYLFYCEHKCGETHILPKVEFWQT